MLAVDLPAPLAPAPRRRRFGLWLAALLVLPRSAAHAQGTSGKVWRVGFLAGNARPRDGAIPEAFRSAMQARGFVEGKDVVYEGRWAEARPGQLDRFVGELLSWRSDLVVTLGAPAAAAMKRASSKVPVVVVYAGDVVETGLVASLARPGGNVTGLNDPSSSLSAKRLELLKQAAPHAAVVAVLWNAGDEAMTMRYRSIEGAAAKLGIAIEPLPVREPDDFELAFAGLERKRPDALMMVADALTNLNRQRVIDYAAAHRLPAIYEGAATVHAGGLMSYGDDTAENFRLAAEYAARILRGTRPGELPVQQPNRYFLVINLKTARSLGLSLPESLRLRADELLE